MRAIFVVGIVAWSSLESHALIPRSGGFAGLHIVGKRVLPAAGARYQPSAGAVGLTALLSFAGSPTWCRGLSVRSNSKSPFSFLRTQVTDIPAHSLLAHLRSPHASCAHLTVRVVGFAHCTARGGR